MRITGKILKSSEKSIFRLNHNSNSCLRVSSGEKHQILFNIRKEQVEVTLVSNFRRKTTFSHYRKSLLNMQKPCLMWAKIVEKSNQSKPNHLNVVPKDSTVEQNAAKLLQQAGESNRG